MNEIEKQRIELSNSLSQLFGKTKIFSISSFYTSLLNTFDSNIIEAYSLDFIQEYLSELKSFTPFYQEPESIELLLSQLNQLKSVATLSQFEKQFDEIIKSITTHMEELRNILDGGYSKSPIRALSFPLLETSRESSGRDSFGTMESVRIRINKSKTANKIVFVPSDKKNEERLLTQAILSFELALDYFNNHKKKFSSYHEILIYFENLSAIYEGGSLGVALTIGFIEQHSILYNLPFIANIKTNIATTGRVDEFGNIKPVSAEIIKKKIDIVFYSSAESFIVPKKEEEIARQRKKRLMEKYPNRKLKLVGIENINELLNRRDLVEIEKQSHFVRTARSIKKNWVVSFLLLLLILTITFVYIREYDDNPYTYESTPNVIIIKNRDDRALWNIAFPNYDIHLQGIRYLESIIRILDVNNDGINEVLFTFQHPSKYSNESISDGLILLNYKGKIIWRRSFRKNLTSKREIITPPFGTFIFDTLRINNELCILCGSNNSSSYASAVYILNLKRNKVVSDTLWNSGHINDVRVVDLNNDKKKELIVLACNNGLQKNSLYHLDMGELKGQTPTTDDYKLINVKDAHLLHFFVFPNSDYSTYMNQRYSSVRRRSLEFDYESKTIRFLSSEAGLEKQGNIIYNWLYEINNFNLAIGSDLRLMRDSLVAHGKLPLPYTDTKEYREILRKQILAWDGKKFITLDEYKKKSKQ